MTGYSLESAGWEYKIALEEDSAWFQHDNHAWWDDQNDFRKSEDCVQHDVSREVVPFPTDDLDETLAYLDGSIAVIEGPEAETDYKRKYGLPPGITVRRNQDGIIEGGDTIRYWIDRLGDSDVPEHQTMARILLKQLGEWPQPTDDGK
jgi:hypothetical protein